MEIAQDTTTIAALAAVVVFTLQVGLRVAALGIIPEGRKPSSATAWLAVIFIEPILGLLAFRLFGSTRLGRRRDQRHAEVNAIIAARTREMPRPLESVPAPAYVRSVAKLNRHLGALPVTEGNVADAAGGVQRDAERDGRSHRRGRSGSSTSSSTSWPGTTRRPGLRGAGARHRARRAGPAALRPPRTRGIPGYKDFLERLQGTDIDWHPMLPIKPLKRRWRRPDLRNHRKILVVDGLVAFMGSLNLTEPGYNKPKNHAAGREWKELMTRLEGPVVATLDAVFCSDWFVETDEALTVTAPPPLTRPDAQVLTQVLPSGPGFVAENNLRMFTTLVYGAEHRLSLTSPYFVPDESLLYAVTTAAQRGVEVELFVSEESDQFMVGHAQASYYRALLEAGVRIWMYPSPAILHSKHFSVDDTVGVIGSSNMDMRSFALNYEVSLMLLGDDVVHRLQAVEDHYRSVSRELTLEEWRRRSLRLRWVDNVMRLTAALQ